MEEVIERKAEVQQSNIGEIEKRIAEQNKKENPFKKSITNKTTFEKRQLQRNIKQRKDDKEKKREGKHQEKEEGRMKRFKGHE